MEWSVSAQCAYVYWLTISAKISQNIKHWRSECITTWLSVCCRSTSPARPECMFECSRKYLAHEFCCCYAVKMLRSNRTTTTNLCACVHRVLVVRSSLSAVRQSTASDDNESLSHIHTHSQRLGVYAVCDGARQSTVRQKIMEDGKLWICENKMEIFALRAIWHTLTLTCERNAVHLMIINTQHCVKQSEFVRTANILNICKWIYALLARIRVEFIK